MDGSITTANPDNPFIKGAQDYLNKKPTDSELPVKSFGPITPYAGLKKKEPSPPASTPGGQNSSTGSSYAPGFSDYDPNTAQAEQQASAQRHARNPISPSARVETLQEQKENPGSEYYQHRREYQDLQDAQRAQDEKENPGSWSNVFPTLVHAIGQFGSSAAGFGANVVRDAAGMLPGADKNSGQNLYERKPIYYKGTLVGYSDELSDYGKSVDEGKQKDPLGSFILGMDAYQSETNKADQSNPLPHTFLGNTVSGAIHIAPDIATVLLLPEEEAMQGGSLLDEFKAAAVNPFTKLQAAKGATSGYSEAKRSGENGIGGAIKGAAEGEASGTTMSLLGTFASDVVSPKLIQGLKSTGLMTNGKWTKIGADMLSDATVFGAYPIASNLIQGKPINWDDVQSGVGTGLGFGIMKGRATANEHGAVEDQVKQTLQDGQGVALQNFANATPDAIIQAYNMADKSGDLTAKAVDYAHQTINEPDIAKKKELAAASSTYMKAAGLSGTAEAIMNDKDDFIKSIQESDLPDDQKQAIIDKANIVQKQLDPTEQAKQLLGKKITELDQHIATASAQNTTDPVQKTENEVGIENLTKLKDEAYKQLKGIITDQHQQMQKGEEPNAIREQGADALPIQPAPGDSEGVGKGNTEPGSVAEQGINDQTQESNQQNQIENETNKQTAQNGQDEHQPESGQSTEHEQAESGSEQGGAEGEVTQKVKVSGDALDVPALKDSPYQLSAVELPNGKHGIYEAGTGKLLSKLYDSRGDLDAAFERNKDKLTPDVIEQHINPPKDSTPERGVSPITPKAESEINKNIEPTELTVQNIKDYENSRKPVADVPASGSEKPRSVSETVQQPGDDKSAGKNKNTKREAVPGEPEGKPASKREQLDRNLEDAKKELSAKIKKSRSNLSSGINPDVLSSMAKVVKAYADIGIHKFSEMVKDWINTFGKDNFTDDDADAFKGAYAAHVSSLEPKERGKYNTAKELDTFMNNEMKVLRGQQQKASLPKYTKQPPRLPLPQEESEEPQSRKNYSAISKLKSYAIHNLEQLKAFSEDIRNFDALRAVRQFATSKSQASVVLKTATQAITKLVGKAGWDDLRQALVESRLQGIRDRWNKYADQTAKLPDEEVKTMFDDGKDGNMYDLVKNLKPLAGEGNPAKLATSLITSGNYDDARNYLSNIYRQAADNVLTLGVDVAKTMAKPNMKQALDVYKNLLETPIKESHASNEGVFSDSLGPLDTYYPLIGENADKPRLIAKGKPFNEPGNIDNRFATGQSDNYDTEIAGLADKLASSIKNNNKANAIDALKQVGLIADVPHNAPETSQMQVGNDVWDFTKEKVGDSKTIIDPDGHIINTPSKYVMMPTWLKSELDPIFDAKYNVDQYSPIGKVMNIITKVALGGPTEAIAHSYRMLGVLTNSMPFMHEWAYREGIQNHAGGYVANNLFVKKWTGLFKILNTDISSDKALQTIQEMSKLGIIPEKTWTKTYSKEFADLTGAKASRIKFGKVDIPNFTDFSPMLYGKNSIDLKARVLMYNLTKAMNPDATPEQHVKMQNELGVYTRSLQSTLERQVKESGLAPYYTFGSAVYRTALKSVLGLSPLPVDARTQPGKFATYKAAQLLTNGIIGSAAMWILLHHAQTNKWPWEDQNSKLGRLPFPGWAKGKLSQQMWGDGKGGYKDLNMLAVTNPIIERGLRATGAEKAYETHQLGGTAGQSLEAGATQAMNTFFSPFTSSPALQLGTTAVTGSAPYVTGLRDDKGKPSPQLFQKVKATPFGTQPLANTYAALKELNPFIDYGITQLNRHDMGFEKSLFGLRSITNSDFENEGASSLGFVLNMAFPRFFVAHGNDDTKQYYIQKEHQQLERTMEKERGKEEVTP